MTQSMTLERAAREQGMVFVVVLWVIACLIAVLLLYAEGMRMEYRAAANSAATLEAGQAVEGARRYATYVLGNVVTKGVMPVTDDCRVEDVPIDDAHYWIIGRASQSLTSTDAPMYGFTDEASKLNLNTAPAELLTLLPGMTAEFAGAIVDWRDDNSEPEVGGAEADTYLMDDPAYECKNAPFESVEELRLVKGATMALLYGEDTNLNGVLDANENDGDENPPADNADGKLDCGLLEYVTVFSREPNMQSDGTTGRINVTKVNDRQVRDQLTTYIDNTLGTGGRSGEILASVGTAPVTSVLEFYARGKVTAAEGAKLEDGLTAADGDFVTGLVNVNTAPREVLYAITGIGDKYADAIVSTRQSKTTDEMKTVAWLLSVFGEDTDAITNAGKYLTARTYRISADIAAVAHAGRAFRRSWTVFDTSASTGPIVVFRRDRTGLGWPLGTTLRDQYDGISDNKGIATTARRGMN